MYPNPCRLLALLACLLLQACASQLQPESNYLPPPGAEPMENSDLDTGQLEPVPGHKGDQIGAEVISTRELGDEQQVEIRVPIDPALVDQVQVYDASGQPLPMSREAQIIHNYETNNVGISIKIPNSDNLGFRLKLIDHPDNEWPPVRHQ